MNTNQEIVNWLVNNRQYILDQCKLLISEYNTMLKQEDSAFFGDITEEFARTVRELISIECGKSIGLSPSDIIECIQDLNLELYLHDTNE